uniref:Uncharacterized protein n=1 Tax=Anguilla anguilla TaxID=7936 RepID=A0A0E9WDC0_ANGAN
MTTSCHSQILYLKTLLTLKDIQFLHFAFLNFAVAHSLTILFFGL